MYDLTHHKATPFQMFVLSQIELLVSIRPALLRPLLAIFDRLQGTGDLTFRIYDRLEYLSWRAQGPDDVPPPSAFDAVDFDDFDRQYRDELQELEQQWNSLSPEQREEAYEEIEETSVSSNVDASDHWAYPFLRDRLMRGYVGH